MHDWLAKAYALCSSAIIAFADCSLSGSLGQTLDLVMRRAGPSTRPVAPGRLAAL